MLMLSVEAEGMLNSQIACELLIVVVLPLTTAVLPTYSSACVACALCCSETSVDSESLVLSCSWTPANSTSCWGNWLGSSGSSGFWFCSCVVNSSRKLWKLPAICCEAIELAEAAAFELELEELDDEGVVPETIWAGVFTPLAL